MQTIENKTIKTSLDVEKLYLFDRNWQDEMKLNRYFVWYPRLV